MNKHSILPVIIGFAIFLYFAAHVSYNPDHPSNQLIGYQTMKQDQKAYGQEEENESETDSEGDEQGYENYENKQYGFSIEYPLSWKIYENEIDEFTESQKEDSLTQPWMASDDVCFRAPAIKIEDRMNGRPSQPAYFCIAVLNNKVEKYLDTDDMTIKTRTFPNVTCQELAKSELMYGFSHRIGMEKLVRNNETTFGAGTYPAWRIDSTYRTTGGSGLFAGTDAGYQMSFHSVVGGKISIIKASSVDMVIAEYMPILTHMIDSFRITDKETERDNNSEEVSN